jgi:hypothetical protein
LPTAFPILLTGDLLDRVIRVERATFFPDD